MKARQRDLLALKMVPGLGAVGCGRLIDKAGDVSEVFGAGGEDLCVRAGLDRNFASYAREKRNSEEVLSEIDYMRKNDISAVCIGDGDYPGTLKNIYGPPVMLFCRGRVSSLRGRAVAIVGSRRCSAYGMRMAEKLAFELACRGITVVSGLARGVDTAAHRGALRARGSTVAVMGSGFRRVYPPEAGNVIQSIAARGCVVTEYVSDVSPDKSTFPNRNRIISGLSLGVIIVEAARRSGALITARFALEQGREVFALPGNADSFLSRGTNRLIQEGAKLVTCVDDVLEELVPDVEEDLFPGGGDIEGGKDQFIVGALRRKGTMHRDEILEMTGMEAGKLSAFLLGLELKGNIKPLPGGRYAASRQI